MASLKKSVPPSFEEYKKKLESTYTWPEQLYTNIPANTPPLPDIEEDNSGPERIEPEAFNPYRTFPDVKSNWTLRSAPKEEEKQKKPSTKRTNPLEGRMADVDGPILKLYLLQKGAFVIGWFEFIDEGLRQLMTMQRFTAKNGINIYAKEGPQMVSDTILLPGIRKDRDDQHIQNAFRNTEDAMSGLNTYLEALREFTNLVRGISEVDNKIGTKFNQQYEHIF